MAMACLAQYSVSPEQHWRPSSTALLCSRATKAPWYPRSSDRTAHSGNSSRIPMHDWTRRNNEKPISRTHARRLRPSLKMRVVPQPTHARS